MTIENNGWQVEDVLLALQCGFHQFEKVPNFVVRQVSSFVTPQATNFFI